ncbi:MAG: NnrS family protein [Hydrogenovibrio sp.]|uniref:NnrS family protein n=1 Tax=Hydrogenovibrio sp. TaxID=2065821 RepID=UPI0028701FEA|nr:NnrS family protein [Hydrogenovibrio sp.]MDR9498729.1 NnrS family protein [Hydrogenovibrio sp.]
MMHHIQHHFQRHFFWERAFRPFFIGAMIVSVVAMSLWALAWLAPERASTLPVSLNSSLAHGHEMVFGYALATVSGFLLTAVLNWSRMTTASGGVLAFVFLLWVLARIGWVGGIPLGWVAAFDLAFNLGLAWLFLWPVWQKRLSAQAGLAAKFGLLAVANAGFYAALIWPQSLTKVAAVSASDWLLAGLILVLAINLTMLRRLMPFFTERSLNTPAAVDMPWLNRLAMVGFLLLWPLWVFWPDAPASFGIALITTGVFAWRGWVWYQPGIWAQPLLWPLHLSYAFITLGIGLFALSALSWANLSWVHSSLAMHAMSVGGIGLLCSSMIARISLGHTHRNVFAPPKGVSAVFVLIAVAAVVRVFVPLVWPAFYHWAIMVSALAWILAFAWLLWLYWPILTQPSLQAPNQLPGME